MSVRAPVPATDPLIVTLTAGQLRALVLDVVQAAVDEVARPRPTALIDTQDLATELHVSEPTIRKMRDEGMPVIRIGETYRYELAAVLAWLRQRGKAA
jgi:hypothetical protein